MTRDEIEAALLYEMRCMAGFEYVEEVENAKLVHFRGIINLGRLVHRLMQEMGVDDDGTGEKVGAPV